MGLNRRNPPSQAPEKKPVLNRRPESLVRRQLEKDLLHFKAEAEKIDSSYDLMWEEINKLAAKETHIVLGKKYDHSEYLVVEKEKEGKISDAYKLWQKVCQFQNKVKSISTELRSLQ